METRLRDREINIKKIIPMIYIYQVIRKYNYWFKKNLKRIRIEKDYNYSTGTKNHFIGRIRN